MELIIVSDASTLVLLEKINLLKKMLKKYKIIIPAKVHEEAVLKGIEKKVVDAYRIREHIIKKTLEIKKVKDRLKLERLAIEYNLGEGEAEAIMICFEQKINLLATDDHKAINVCKIYKIPFGTAISFVLINAKEKAISEIEAKEMIINLGKYGRYKSELIFEALKIIGDKK